MSEPSPAHEEIRTPDRRLRVFVSSTLGELAEERRTVERAIAALRLTPVMFELGARPHPPRDLYRAYLAQSDIFVGLYWQRYGQVVTGTPVSGLEEEFDLSGELPRLLYVKAPAPDREPRLTDLLSRIKEVASYRGFKTDTELGRLVRDDLATLLSERFVGGPGAPFSASARGSAATKATARRPATLPADTTSMVGRADDVDEVAGVLAESGTRLVTLTGPGGVGKTRLAVAVAERLTDRFDAGVVFVPLAEVTEPGLVLAGMLRAFGADLAGVGSPLEALIEQLGEGHWLFVLDNLEQVIDVAGDLDDLLASCPGVAVLATSRTVLRLRAEHEYPVQPLPLPANPSGAPVDVLAESPAVALFVDRASAVRHDFRLTAGNAVAVVEICRRLEGLPLAIELAASRTRLLDPDALLRRLATSLDALGIGPVDMPARQLTLRATVEWSVGLLDEAERSLLASMAIFVDGWTVEAAAQVADVDEERAFDVTDALVGHSLIYLDRTEFGPRWRMLETIRTFVAEQLSDGPDGSEIRRRHAEYYRGLAEQADLGLRGADDPQRAAELERELSNVVAAVRWYLTNDPGPLPHLLRVLYPLWAIRDRLRETLDWVEQLMPVADSLDERARAELLWTAAMTATEIGDDAVALQARDRLLPLVGRAQDPLLYTLSRLTIAWTSPIVGDLDGALRAASDGLELLQGQNEPFWTLATLATLGALDAAVGHDDDAQRHSNELLVLAERLHNARMPDEHRDVLESRAAAAAAESRAGLGNLAVKQGRLDEARALLDDALDFSLASRSIRCVILCLDAYSRLAYAEANLQRAALLAGAAEGIRQRAKLRAWPTMRRGEAEAVAQIHQTFGAERFDEAFASGTRLDQRQAVAVVRDQHGVDAAPSPPYSDSVGPGSASAQHL